MKFVVLLLASWLLVVACQRGPAQAAGPAYFERVAVFEARLNHRGSRPAVAEIVAYDPLHSLLVFTNSGCSSLDLVDLREAEAPQPAGAVALEGEPTSVAVHHGQALVAVDLSPSKEKPVGQLVVVDLASRMVIRKVPLEGQPDCVAVSPNGRWAAVAIENERDEELPLPQSPAGWLAVVDLESWEVRRVSLTGLAEVFPQDPEPEFVDIDQNNRAVVTLQENNHLVLVDLEQARVEGHFSAGSSSLSEVDQQSDGQILFNEQSAPRPREPDAVTWLPSGLLATANEGDWVGGSRSFTLFTSQGEVVYDSGSQLDHLAARLGHYNDRRSSKRGTEPEGIEAHIFADQSFLFVALERANLSVVYKVKGQQPIFHQVLPAASAPEGVLAIPERQLLVVAREADGGLVGGLSIFRLSADQPTYPEVEAVEGLGWGALSGLTGSDPTCLYAVPDNAYRPSRLYQLDVTQEPAQVQRELLLVDQDDQPISLDFEGVALASDGFFLVAEGRGHHQDEDKTPNLLLHFDFQGRLIKQVELPSQVAEGQLRFGFEGVEVIDGEVFVLFQRPWENDQAGMTKLGRWRDDRWDFFAYPLDSASRGWVGGSELAKLGGQLIVLERDNQKGSRAAVKRLYRVEPNSLRQGQPVKKSLFFDLRSSFGDEAPEKLEGVTFLEDGRAVVLSDNDGDGETRLLIIKSAKDRNATEGDRPDW